LPVAACLHNPMPFRSPSLILPSRLVFLRRPNFLERPPALQLHLVSRHSCQPRHRLLGGVTRGIDLSGHQVIGQLSRSMRIAASVLIRLKRSQLHRAA
jgi:hypothetical protein